MKHLPFQILFCPHHRDNPERKHPPVIVKCLYCQSTIFYQNITEGETHIISCIRCQAIIPFDDLITVNLTRMNF